MRGTRRRQETDNSPNGWTRSVSVAMKMVAARRLMTTTLGIAISVERLRSLRRACSRNRARPDSAHFTVKVKAKGGRSAKRDRKPVVTSSPPAKRTDDKGGRLAALRRRSRGRQAGRGRRARPSERKPTKAFQANENSHGDRKNRMGSRRGLRSKAAMLRLTP